jgi:hypothetical protein
MVPWVLVFAADAEVANPAAVTSATAMAMTKIADIVVFVSITAIE